MKTYESNLSRQGYFSDTVGAQLMLATRISSRINCRRAKFLLLI
jgi:hypothetical protein